MPEFWRGFLLGAAALAVPMFGALACASIVAYLALREPADTEEGDDDEWPEEDHY